MLYEVQEIAAKPVCGWPNFDRNNNAKHAEVEACSN